MPAFDAVFIAAVVAFVVFILTLWFSPEKKSIKKLLLAIMASIMFLGILVFIAKNKEFESTLFGIKNKESTVEQETELVSKSTTSTELKDDKGNSNQSDERVHVPKKKDYNNAEKEETLAKAYEYAESGDYLSAISLIKNAQGENGEDTEYTSAYNEYCTAYKSDAISAAEKLAESRDYAGAIKIITEVTDIIGDDSDLNTKASAYEDLYVSATVSLIEEYVEANDYISAENTLTTALSVCPTNQALIAESEVVKNAVPRSIMDACPPYKTKSCEMWTNMSMGGNKYATGFSIGAKTGFTNYGEEGFALFNLSQKYRTLSFEVGNIDDRGNRTGESLYIYLDRKLVWSLDLDPEALPTRYDVDISGASQMKFVGTGEAGDYGITNMVISGITHLDTDNANQVAKTGDDLLLVLPPYKTKNYESLKNLSMGGNKYATGFSIGAKTGFTNYGEEGFALFNLSQKYRTLSFEVGNIDDRGNRTGESLHIYLDTKLVWSLDLDPEALPTRYDVDISGATQMKFVGTGEAGDYGVANITIK